MSQYIWEFDQLSQTDTVDFPDPTRVTVEYECGHFTQFTVVGSYTKQTKQWCDHCVNPQRIKLLVNRDAAPKQPGAMFQVGDIVTYKESK